MSNFYTLFAGILAHSWFELWNLTSFLFIIWVLKLRLVETDIKKSTSQDESTYC